MRMPLKRTWTLGVAVLIPLAAWGCKKEAADQPQAQTEEAAKPQVTADAESAADAAAEPAAASEVEAKLAKADALDGETDKVISKCASCMLRMDGSEEHVYETHGYKLHFCSAGCKERFSENASKAVLALNVGE